MKTEEGPSATFGRGDRADGAAVRGCRPAILQPTRILATRTFHPSPPSLPSHHHPRCPHITTLIAFTSLPAAAFVVEFAASKLARGTDMPILVIESTSQLSYFNPCDTTKLIAAHGEFSVASDISTVNHTLEKMAISKVRRRGRD